MLVSELYGLQVLILSLWSINLKVCYFYFASNLINFQSGGQCMTEYDFQFSILLSRDFLLNLSSLLQEKVHIFKLGERII
jgi:hypothetical protein